MSAAKKLAPVPLPGESVIVNGATVQWRPGNHGLTFFGVDSVLFWLKPSLASILQPLREEIGEELYGSLIAFEASKGTYEDYHAMVSGLGNTFEEGFFNWGEAVSSAGWGRFHIRSIDWMKKEAVVQVENPWELRIFQAKEAQNSVPFVIGKVTGIFAHAFACNIRCSAVTIETSPCGERNAILVLRPSEKTLEQTLIELHETRNLSERESLKAINNALRRNQRRLLDAMESVGDFIWESDLKHRLTFCTSKAGGILHREGEELVGLSWGQLLGAQGLSSLHEKLEQISLERRFAEADFLLETESGEQVWIHLRAKQLLDISGNHIGYVGSGRDITAKHNLRQSLEYSAKMASLGEMAGGVAHEINTPLTVLALTAESLLKDCKNNPEMIESVNLILSTTTKIGGIVQGLRSFARDAVQDPLLPTPVRSIVDDTLALCRSRFHNSGVVLRLNEISQELIIPCRSTQIAQVLLNLLNNAFDAAIESKDKWIELNVSKTSSAVVIRVSDSGAGIPAAAMGKIMNPFFTTKPIGKGTGLGLSISKGLVESHGGSLRYDLNSPHTCFIVELPL